MSGLTTTTPISILRAKEVRDRTGLSRSTIFLKIRRGEFPAGVLLGDRAIGWRSDEIDRWIMSRQHATADHHEYAEQPQRPPVPATSHKPTKVHKRAPLAGRLA